MTVKERVKKFIKYKKISVRSFEESIGVSYGYINSMRISMQPDKIKNIALQYSDLNIDWLLTGEGEMLKKTSSASEKLYNVPENIIQTLSDSISKYGIEGTENSDSRMMLKLIQELNREIGDLREEIGRLKALLNIREGKELRI